MVSGAGGGLHFRCSYGSAAAVVSGGDGSACSKAVNRDPVGPAGDDSVPLDACTLDASMVLVALAL